VERTQTGVTLIRFYWAFEGYYMVCRFDLVHFVTHKHIKTGYLGWTCGCLILPLDLFVGSNINIIDILIEKSF
jgi:hypothetical protein